MHNALTIQKSVVSDPSLISAPSFLISNIPHNTSMTNAKENPMAGWMASLFLRSFLISFFTTIDPPKIRFQCYSDKIT